MLHQGGWLHPGGTHLYKGNGYVRRSRRPFHASLAVHQTPTQSSKFWLSVRLGQPKKSPDNQQYWCSCPTDNHKFWRPSSTAVIIVYLVPCTDNQKLGRTTRNCNPVVRGTIIYFFIRTLPYAVAFCSSSEDPSFLKFFIFHQKIVKFVEFRRSKSPFFARISAL